MNENLILPDPQPSRADAVKNRALLLETAQELFAEQGVDAVSMTAIADAAGVGKGTLYRHFKNKIDLCNALLDEEQRDLQRRTLEHLSQPGDPTDKLCWFVEAVLHFVLRNLDMLSAGMNEVDLRHPAHIWWRQTISGLLTQIDPPGDNSYIADVLYIMLEARNVSFQRDHLGYADHRIADGLLDTVERLTR